MSRPVVIVMVKAPRAGLAKTRLVPPLTPEQAAALAACFARDTLTNARRVAGEHIVAYTPPDARSTLEAYLPPDSIWLAQEGDDLGARLEFVARRASALGFSPLVILGADSPTLPASCIKEAFDALEAGDADIALGPTDDGGYYLVGLRRPVSTLFMNVEWSTPRVYRQTADNAARLSLRLLRLPRWYDVDTPADLQRLREEIFSDAAARRRAPSTYQWLLTHDVQIPSSL